MEAGIGGRMTRRWFALCLVNLLLVGTCAVSCCDESVDVKQSADAWPF